MFLLGLVAMPVAPHPSLALLQLVKFTLARSAGLFGAEVGIDAAAVTPLGRPAAVAVATVFEGDAFGLLEPG